MEFIIPRFMRMYLEEKESNNFKELFEEGFKDKEEEIVEICNTSLQISEPNKIISKEINLDNEKDKNLFRYMHCWTSGICNEKGLRTYHDLIHSRKLKPCFENEVGYLINHGNNYIYIFTISPIDAEEENIVKFKINKLLCTAYPSKFFPYSDEMGERLDKINKEKGIEMPSIMSFEPSDNIEEYKPLTDNDKISLHENLKDNSTINPISNKILDLNNKAIANIIPDLLEEMIEILDSHKK